MTIQQAQRKGISRKTWEIVALIGVLSLFAVDPAFAQAASGGLDKVNTFLQTIQTVLTGAAIATVTIAITWAGYKYLFKHADLAEVGKILAGGLLIGGASQFASFLLG